MHKINGATFKFQQCKWRLKKIWQMIEKLLSMTKKRGKNKKKKIIENENIEYNEEYLKELG